MYYELDWFNAPLGRKDMRDLINMFYGTVVVLWIYVLTDQGITLIRGTSVLCIKFDCHI